MCVVGSGTPVLVDTMIMIEAVRTGCWAVVRGHYNLIMVSECKVEAMSGAGHERDYVRITEVDFEGVQIVEVDRNDRARLIVTCQDVAVLHPGERDLWAYGLSREDLWRAVCADRAAVKVAMKLGWGDRLVSLEELVLGAGARVPQELKRHYTRDELARWRRDFLLGM